MTLKTLAVTIGTLFISLHSIGQTYFLMEWRRKSCES